MTGPIQAQPKRLEPHPKCPQCGTAVPSGNKSVFCANCRFPLLLLADRYRLERKLGEGGCGVVYLAHSAEKTEPSVVKVLRPSLSDKGTIQQRFKREIRLTRKLARLSEHIVQIEDHGQAEQLGLYYVMEYLDGVDLQTLMFNGRIRTLKEVFLVFMQICEALSVAHRHGVIHRDLKPENVIVMNYDNEDLFVKLLDFGVAKTLNHTTQGQLTTGALGTPFFMPPEQFLNKDIDERSDIYSLGIMLYEMLAGKLPFESKDISVLMFQHVREQPKPLREHRPDLPKGLEDVVNKAIAKQPEDRYPTVQRLWQDLVPFAELEDHILFGSKELMALGETIGYTDISEGEISLQSPFVHTDPAKTRMLKPKVDESTNLTVKESDQERRMRQEAWAATIVYEGDAQESLEEGYLPLPEKIQTPTLEYKLPWWKPALFFLVTITLGALMGYVFYGEETYPIGNVQPEKFSSKRRTPTRQEPQRTVPPKRPKKPMQQIVQKKNMKPKIQAKGLRRQKRKRRRRRRVWIQRVNQKVAKKKVRKVQARLVTIVHQKKSESKSVAPPTQHPCGEAKPGMRWLIAKAPKVVFGLINLEFSNCPHCKLKRQERRMCVQLPVRRTRIRLSAQGYIACTHWVPRKTRSLYWRLKEANNETLIDEVYRCYQ